MALTFLKEFSGLTEHRFYKGQELLLFDAKKHEYYLAENNGLTLIPGCSSICHIIDKSEALINWAVKVVMDKVLVSSLPYHCMSQGDCTGEFVIPDSKYHDLLASAKKAHKEKLDEASNIGRIAHNWIEQYINVSLIADLSRAIEAKTEVLNKLPDNEQARNCCIAAVSWMDQHNVRWLCTEKKVYSRKYRYAGTLDGMALTDACQSTECCKTAYKNRLSLVDWKSSNSLYPEHLLQTASYLQAILEEYGES